MRGSLGNLVRSASHLAPEAFARLRIEPEIDYLSPNLQEDGVAERREAP